MACASGRSSPAPVGRGEGRPLQQRLPQWWPQAAQALPVTGGGGGSAPAAWEAVHRRPPVPPPEADVAGECHAVIAWARYAQNAL